MGMGITRWEWEGIGIEIAFCSPLVWSKVFGPYGPADATTTPLSLASLKCRMVSLFGAGLHRLFWNRAFKWM